MAATKKLLHAAKLTKEKKKQVYFSKCGYSKAIKYLPSLSQHIFGLDGTIKLNSLKEI